MSASARLAELGVTLPTPAAPLAAYLKRFDLTLESALRPSVGLARLREGGGAVQTVTNMGAMTP